MTDTPSPKSLARPHSRRAFLRTAPIAAAAGYTAFQSKDVFAMTEDENEKVVQAVSEHARPTVHSQEVHDLPRWTPSQTGPYRLTRTLDNHFSFAKVQANLGGQYTWLGQYGWIVMAPPGEPAYPFLARVQGMQVFATPAADAEHLVPDAGEHDYLLWGTFTTVHVDPRTFEPVERVYNPYTDRMIDVPTLHYADRLAFRVGKSILVPGVDPAFYTQPWDRDGGFSQHYIDAGDEITYTVLGSAQAPGPQQPRCDIGFWAAQEKDLMNPNLVGCDTRRDYSATMKVSEYAWYGVELGDQAQLMVHLTGWKSENISKMPSLVREHVIERFPERWVV